METKKLLILLGGISVIGLIIFVGIKSNSEVEEDEFRYISNVSGYTEDGAIDPAKYLKKGEVFVENKKSDILKEDREFFDYSITEFKVVKGNEENRIVMEINNLDKDKISEREIVVKLLDKEYNTIDNVYIFVPEMKMGDVLYLNGITNIEAEKIFDYKIVEND